MKSADEIPQADGGIGDWSQTLVPVTLNWLWRAFRMNQQTVKKRLAKLEPIGYRSSNQPLYDFVQAAGYLVKPKMDLDEYIKSLDPNRLPNHINKAYWEAKRIRLKYMVEAGDAWVTEDVLTLFGEVFLTMKDRMQLWVDTLADETNLTDDQRARMRQMVDALQTDLHASLIEIPATRRTHSMAMLDYAPANDPVELGDDIEDLLG